jgi:hypothetical protein
MLFSYKIVVLQKTNFMTKHLLTLLFMGALTACFAQSNVLSSGKKAEASTGKVTYSVGLVHYKEASGAGGSSNAGAQIPIEVLETLSLDSNHLISVSVFPNPTSETLNVTLKNEDTLTYVFTDISGKRVQSGYIKNRNTQLNISNFENAIYVLSFYKNNNLLESYKIIKK